MKLLAEHRLGKSEFYSCDLRMQHKDGHWIWVFDRGQVISRDENGKALLMSGTHADITERVLQAEALEQSEEESRRLFEAMNQALHTARFSLMKKELPMTTVFSG